jgi:hypothetical protein
MKLEQVKEIWKGLGVKKTKDGPKISKMTKTELIHNIQIQEGNSPCFKSEFANVCGQHNCLWRKDCTK